MSDEPKYTEQQVRAMMSVFQAKVEKMHKITMIVRTGTAAFVGTCITGIAAIGNMPMPLLVGPAVTVLTFYTLDHTSYTLRDWLIKRKTKKDKLNANDSGNNDR